MYSCGIILFYFLYIYIFFFFSFNMLKLPDYETLEDMEKKLRVAVTCGGQGFEFT